MMVVEKHGNRFAPNDTWPLIELQAMPGRDPTSTEARGAACGSGLKEGQGLGGAA
jgi:hypothetical protein